MTRPLEVQKTLAISANVERYGGNVPDALSAGMTQLGKSQRFFPVTFLVTFVFCKKRGLPVEIRKPLLLNHLNGCGGQI